MSEEPLKLTTILDSPILSRIIVGIGETSEITGVSARQLRYWESKGIIQSIGANDGSNRRYDYPNIEKIVLLKDFLDQGYTLEAATRLLEKRIQKLNNAIKLSSKKSDIKEVRYFTNINGQDYFFIGYAIHHTSQQRLKIFSPLNEDYEGLLAVPID